MFLYNRSTSKTKHLLQFAQKAFLKFYIIIVPRPNEHFCAHALSHLCSLGEICIFLQGFSGSYWCEVKLLGIVIGFAFWMSWMPKSASLSGGA